MDASASLIMHRATIEVARTHLQKSKSAHGSPRTHLIVNLFVNLFVIHKLIEIGGLSMIGRHRKVWSPVRHTVAELRPCSKLPQTTKVDQNTEKSNPSPILQATPGHRSGSEHVHACMICAFSISKTKREMCARTDINIGRQDWGGLCIYTHTSIYKCNHR